MALGGVQNVASIFAASRSTVYNWCARKQFPSKTYMAMSGMLSDRGFVAEPSLWGMVRIPDSTSS